MKFLVSIIAFLILITSILLFSIPKTFDTKLTSPSPTPRADPNPVMKTIPKQIKMIEVSLNNQQFVLFAAEILQQATLNLYPNFSQKESAKTLVEINDCDQAINGGFYQENGRSLGLFVSEGSKAGELIKSNLVNGFFWQDKEGKRFIGISPPTFHDVSFIFQSGPYIQVGDYKLRLVSDEPTRRSFLGIDKDNRLYMIVVIEKENTIGGPHLADIPVIFNGENVQKQIPFVTLLNLDGGSASFFYAKDEMSTFSLSEITPIGSLLCVSN